MFWNNPLQNLSFWIMNGLAKGNMPMSSFCFLLMGWIFEWVQRGKRMIFHLWQQLTGCFHTWPGAERLELSEIKTENKSKMTYSPSRCLQTVDRRTTLSALVRLKNQLTSRLASHFLLWPESWRTHCAKAKSFSTRFFGFHFPWEIEILFPSLSDQSYNSDLVIWRYLHDILNTTILI